ncbi:MAG: ISAs1 family transposase [Pseudomonadota bacterium]|nr:ISAs1 family transposase [Pseudomonadota bacterium]
MECTSSRRASATAAPTPVTAATLVAAFADLPDPRRRASVTYPLAAMLALAVTAILANQQGVLAMAEWAARQGAAVLVPLGFAPGRTPCQSTLHRLFAKLNGAHLSAALQTCFASAAAPDPTRRGGQGVAIDGKAQRGRLSFQTGGSPVHALTAFCHDPSLVLAQEPLEQGEEKSEAELTVAPKLIARLDWRGRVLTGDALFCQRELCRQVTAAGGDYLIVVKGNQPTLYDDLCWLFDPPPSAATPLPLHDRREARTVDKGHGRLEVRHLIASTDLVEYSDWPALAQVVRIERTWLEHGERKQHLHYGITSLPPAVADAGRLLALKRGHWAIENGLHYVKDVTLGEDRSLVHVAHGPTILSTLRDTAVNLLRLAGCRTIASRLRIHAQDPSAALALVLAPIPTHA